MSQKTDVNALIRAAAGKNPRAAQLTGLANRLLGTDAELAAARADRDQAEAELKQTKQALIAAKKGQTS